MGKRKVCHKEMMSRQEAIDVVRTLLAGLESGEISVGEGKDELRLGVPDDVKVSLKSKVKGVKTKVSIGLSWKQEGDVPAERVESTPPATQVEAAPPATQEKAKVPAKKAKPSTKESAKSPTKSPGAKKTGAKKAAKKE